jgi:predicted CXXCH cytochrome family protein
VIMKYNILFNICVALILLVSDISFAEVLPPKNPNSAKGCAICHYRWIDTFFIEGKGSDLVEYSAEKVAATPERCMSCHDGGIVDSRAKMRNGFSHKVGVAPDADMKIPDIFPLGEKGKIQCATCHTAHGVPSDPNSDETIFLRTSNKDSRMCKMCHIGTDTTVDQGNTQGNNMVLDISKDIHQREHAPLTSEKKKRPICESCHAAHGAEYEQSVIYSAQNSTLCLECHVDANPLSPDHKEKMGHPSTWYQKT